MTEQQEHLSQLLEQQQQILANLNALNNQMTAGREALLRVQGAINYLQEVGVTLPEPEVEAEVAEEAAAELEPEGLLDGMSSTRFDDEEWSW